MALLVKHALKTAIGAAIVGAVFQQSNSIAIIHYPAMGLVSTMQSNLGGTLQAGWGRLGGSACGGIIGAILLSTWGSNPITGGAAFVLAAIFCDLLQLPSLFTQAGVIASLIAASEMARGENPLIYAFNRVLDNGIGVIIGTVVTIVFWPDNPREILVSNFTQFLANCDHLFQGVVSNYLHSDKVDLSELFEQSRNKIEQNQSSLNQITYGGAGRQITQENWSEVLASQRLFLRYLTIMFNLSKRFDNQSFSHQFEPELLLISQQISLVFQDLSQRFKKEQPLATPLIASLQEQLRLTIQKLIMLQSNPIKDQKLLVSIIDFHAFLNALKELIQELEQLCIKKTKPNLKVLNQKKFTLKLISQERLVILLKTGVTIGLCLAVLDSFFQIPYNYYAIVGVIVAMQPTLGKGIIVGGQRVICTLIGTIYALVIINTLGANYFTLGLGVFSTVVTSAYFGFTHGYHAGCFPVIVGILAHSDNHNAYVWGRLSETVLGVVIGVAASLIFGTETAANKLDQQLFETFKKIKVLYHIILSNYLQKTNAKDIEKIVKEIKQEIQIQQTLQNETKKSYVDELMASKKQRIWNFLINSEIEILRHLLYLDLITKNQNGIMKEYRKDFETIMETTIQGLNYLTVTIYHQTKQPPIQLLNSCIELENKLLAQKEQRENIYESLDKEINFYVIFSTLREITALVEQTIINFPDYKNQS